MALPAFASPRDYHPELTERRMRTAGRVAVQGFDAAHRGLRHKQGEHTYTAGFSRAERTRQALDKLEAKVDWLKVVEEHNRISYCIFIGDQRTHLPMPLRLMYGDEIPEAFEHEAMALQVLERGGQPEQLGLFEYFPPGIPRTAGRLRVRLKLTHNGAENLKERRAIDVSCVVLNADGIELYNWNIWRAKDVLPAPQPQFAASAPLPPADEVEAPQFHIRIIDKPHEDSGD